MEEHQNNISSDQRPPKYALLEHLNESFSYVRQRLYLGKDVVLDPPSCVLPPFLRQVTVNFIDPTTSSITTSSGASVNKQIQLYEKFVAIFQREYNSTLHYVPYQLFRNDSGGLIERLHVRTVVARSHGGGVVLLDDTAQSAVHDYSWEQPFCHVYLAACESPEHYRTKVKPSIQAFVSQLEAASKSSFKQRQGTMRRRVVAESPSPQSDLPDGTVSGNNGTAAAPGSSTGGSSEQAPTSPKPTGKRGRSAPAPRYVIIYVPTGDRSPSQADEVTATPKKPKALVPTVASRFAAARQRIASSTTSSRTTETVLPVDSVHSGTTQDSGENDDSNHNGTSDGEVHLLPASIQKLNKVEREIVRRFANDFPLGNVCTLSTLADGVSLLDSTDDMDETNSHFSKLEWSAVMKAMGTSITAGFQDRCQRFDDELRKLDLQRRGESLFTSRSEPSMDDSTNNSENFYLSSFFLVKESLAFTYEQMRLPAEALLQYSELRAFLPDREMDDDSVNGNDRSTATYVDTEHLTTDILEFRARLRSRGDFTPVAHVAGEYIFVREVSLLFQMHKSVRVVQRCLSYAKSTFELKKSRIDVLADTERSTQQLVDANKWAVNFSWGVKIATDEYYRQVSSQTVLQPTFVRAVCELLDFARLRLEQLGVMLLPQNLVTSHSRSFVQTAYKPWSLWMEPSLPEDTGVQSERNVAETFVEDALSNEGTFVSRYLDLLASIAEYNEFCGRCRFAARLRLERMDIFMSRGEQRQAAREIALVIDVYKGDKWSACQFALLFHLADIQRHIASPREYLETLIGCFSKSSLSLAPSKALDALYMDLESVVRSPSVDEHVVDAAASFGPAFGLEGVVAPRSVGTDRNLLKRLYTVGDTVNVTLSLYSYLPKDIVVDSICINLVSFPKYVAAMEDNLPINADDFCRILSLETTAITSGENTLSFDWFPKSKGQFIIASSVMTWNKVKFAYTAKELRRPTIRIDVVPCTHTQTLVVRPNFLVPGHVQPLRFEFSSGTDVVLKGDLSIDGAPGLTFLPPHAKNEPSAWASSFQCELPRCEPSGTVFLEALVNVALPEGRPSQQPLKAKLSTTYNYPDEEPANRATEMLDADLFVAISTLENTALSTVVYDVTQYSADRAMINVTLKCNTPVPIVIKHWILELPSNFTLADGGDFNDMLRNTSVSTAEQVAMCFDCSFTAEAGSVAVDTVLRIDVENEMGNSFQETVKLSSTLAIEARLKTESKQPVNVIISSSAKEGSVGSPISIVYSIACTGLAQTSGILVYSVEVDDTDWILSGNVGGPVGLVDGPTFEVKLVGIPIRPGRITTFPSLSLTRRVESVVTQIPVKVSSPAQFVAIPPSRQTSVAYSTGK